MTKKEFEKKVKELIKNTGCKVVDIDTISLNSVFSEEKLFNAYVIAISNHVVYKYRVWQNEDITTISGKFIGILGL